MKVAILLVLVLLVMRLASWALQWLLLRLPRIRGRVAIVVGNLAAFGLFAALVWHTLAPGEPMDTDALLFGLVVFGACATSDLSGRRSSAGRDPPARSVAGGGGQPRRRWTRPGAAGTITGSQVR